jgi:hypothetical protein
MLPRLSVVQARGKELARQASQAKVAQSQRAAKQLALQDNARQARLSRTDAIIKAKAREQRQIDQVTAYLRLERRKRNLALIGEEEGAEGEVEEVDNRQGYRKWHTCLNLCCFVVLLLFCNGLFILFLLTMRV